MSWTLEKYAASYQDLIAAYQHLALAVSSQFPKSHLTWMEYHLARTTQGWPEAWQPKLIHDHAQNAINSLTGSSLSTRISTQIRLDEDGYPELLTTANRSVVLFQHGGWTWRSNRPETTWQSCSSFEEGCRLFYRSTQ